MAGYMSGGAKRYGGGADGSLPKQTGPQRPMQQGYSPVAGSAYQPALGQPPAKPTASSGDYSIYSRPSSQRPGYTSQQITGAVNQWKQGSRKGNWQSYLPTGGGVDLSNDDPMFSGWQPQARQGSPSAGQFGGGVVAGPPGGLRAYSDYQPSIPSGGVYQQDPRIIDPLRPPASGWGGQAAAPRPIETFDPMAQRSASPQYDRPPIWAYSQQTPQFSPPSSMPQSTFSAQYGQYGTGGYAPVANTNQRDAFIQRLNDAMAGYQVNSGVYQGQGSPPPSWGQPPQFNIPQMWSDAGTMVQSGWQNPLLGLM